MVDTVYDSKQYTFKNAFNDEIQTQMTNNALKVIYLSKLVIPLFETRYKMSKNKAGIIIIGNDSSISPVVGNSIKGSISQMLKLFSQGLSYETSDMLDIMIYEAPSNQSSSDNFDRAAAACLRDMGYTS